MAGRSDQRQRTVDEAGGTTAEDAEAEERATDEGMPEHPDGATSEATARPDAGPDRPMTVDGVQEENGGHDLGGEA